MRRLLFVLVLPLILVSYSCDSLPESSTKRAERVGKQITFTKNVIKKNDSIYQGYLKSVGSISSYSKKEKLMDNFKTANNNVNIAIKYYGAQVKPILEKNESKLNTKLITHLNTVVNYLDVAVKKSEYPLNRMKHLKNIDDNTTKFDKEAKRTVGLIEVNLNKLEKLHDTYKKRYPAKAPEINTAYTKGQVYFSGAKNSYSVVESNLSSKKEGEDYDLTKIADNHKRVMEDYKSLNSHIKTTTSRFKELDDSYSKTLKDMKADFYVQIGRTSWDSYSDWDTEHNHLYKPRKVDETTYNYFEKLPANTVLASELGGGSGAPRVKINSTHWNKLKINHKESYPSGDDDSEYWLNDTNIKYYHKYIVEKNGKIIDDNKWVEVSEAVFYANMENQGMTILTKPVGVFESETIKEAAPAGMAYVGNPKYGQWKKDSNGNDFWSFYGKYMFFSQILGGHSYSRYEYNDYNRNYRNRGRHYYGSGGQHHYGTRGKVYANTSSYKNSTYRKSYANNSKSSFSRSNLTKSSRATSGRSQSRSARSGASRRGGGPGGRGK